MHVPSFRETVLAQLGQRELRTAIEVDLAGETARARPLDADAKGALRDIHKRVGTAMLFESTGGQIDRVAHLPELRFALGEPDVETTTIDTAAAALAETAFFIRKAGTDGYRIHHQATLRKAVADLRASLDEETEVKPAIRRLVHQEFDQGSRIRKVYFPEDSNAVGDDPRMTLVVVSPEEEWRENGPIAERINQWTRERGRSPRLYPAALVWCIRKPGRDLQDKVELWLAWQKVRSEIDAGTMGPEFERPELNAVSQQIRSAEEEAVEEVKASYRFVALGDSQAENGLKIIDLGAGYSRGGPTLSERVVAALNANALLNESVGAGYIERNWPPALQESGAWPLGSLRQSFLNGSLTRLLDPDAVLREKITEFVERGDFGLASGEQGQGSFSRVWYRETPAQDEVTFDSNTFLITSKAAERALAPPPEEKEPEPEREPQLNPGVQEAPGPYQAPAPPGGATPAADAPESNPQAEGNGAAGELEHDGNQDPDEAPVGCGAEPGGGPLGRGRLRNPAQPPGRHPPGLGGPQAGRPGADRVEGRPDGTSWPDCGPQAPRSSRPDRSSGVQVLGLHHRSSPAERRARRPEHGPRRRRRKTGQSGRPEAK